MSAIQPLYLFLGIDAHEFSKLELQFLEAELFVRICIELKETIREKNKTYLRILKFNFKKEDIMLDIEFIRYIINDILSTGEYNLAGIALYTHTSEDVIYELASGCNTNPTFLLSRKIIELHRTVRPNLYRKIINKIKLEKPLAAA